MADRTGIVGRYNHLLKDLGRAALSSFYPNDIEYYLCAFELMNSTETEAYFVFPIQPSLIQKAEPERTNIKKSLSGITVLRNSSFIPQELSIRGNFGRKFKLLSDLQGFGWGATLSKVSGVTFDTPIFSSSLKTGYGCIKVLQKIIEDARKLDNNGKPKRLYFYNMGFGESYLVTIPPSGVSFSQTEDQNMIWSYQLTMTILAPLYQLAEDTIHSSSKLIVSTGIIQKGLNTVANDIKLLLT